MESLSTIATILLVIGFIALFFAIFSFFKNKLKAYVISFFITSIISLGCGVLIKYYYPNYSIEDFIKYEVTPTGVYVNYKSDPQFCEKSYNQLMTCPRWMSNNMQISMMWNEKRDAYGNKFDIFTIIMAFPKITQKVEKIYVHTGNGVVVSSYDVKVIDNACAFTLSKNDMKKIYDHGIISLSYKSPTGLGFWKRLDKESLVVANEQMLFLCNALDD